MNRRPGSAFHEIVDGADADQPLRGPVQCETNVGPVAAGQDFGLRIPVVPLRLLNHAHERLGLPGGAERLPNVAFTGAGRNKKVDRGQGRPYVVDGGAAHVDLGTGAVGSEELENLRRVPVAYRSETAHGTGAHRMMGGIAGFVAGFAAAHLDFAKQIGIGGKQARLDHRQDGQVDGGGVASDTGDVARASDLLSVEFGQAVDKPFQPFGGGMGFAIPFGIQVGIVEPKIGAAVHDPFGQPLEPVDLLHRLSVRQAEEQELHGLKFIQPGELEPGPLAQVGMGEVDKRTLVAFAGDLGHRKGGVIQKQAQQFAAYVAGSPGDGHRDAVVHGYWKLFGNWCPATKSKDKAGLPADLASVD